jgi:hypothetical protein
MQFEIESSIYSSVRTTLKRVHSYLCCSVSFRFVYTAPGSLQHRVLLLATCHLCTNHRSSYEASLPTDQHSTSTQARFQLCVSNMLGCFCKVMQNHKKIIRKSPILPLERVGVEPAVATVAAALSEQPAEIPAPAPIKYRARRRLRRHAHAELRGRGELPGGGVVKAPATLNVDLVVAATAAAAAAAAALRPLRGGGGGGPRRQLGRETPDTELHAAACVCNHVSLRCVNTNHALVLSLSWQHSSIPCGHVACFWCVVPAAVALASMSKLPASRAPSALVCSAISQRVAAKNSYCTPQGGCHAE